MAPTAKHPDFEVLNEQPYNGNPPASRLVEHRITPVELFYVRNHAPVPEVDPTAYRLEVEGAVGRTLRIGLEELLDRFPSQQVAATLQCAGNRRSELMAVRDIAGQEPWGAGAIGNALWTGVPLAEVLSAVGVDEGAAHVAFTGLDRFEKDGRELAFGGSIPLAQALRGDVVLAFEMNGRPLAPEHGAPLRVVAPGTIGARSVKWLERITVQGHSSAAHHQRRAYKLFPPQVEGPEEADWERAFELGELSVNSAIGRPIDGTEVEGGRVTVRGWAMAGGRRTVEQVELTADGGRSWVWADLERGAPGEWSLWRAEVELAPGEHELACRAWDSAANTQPEDPARVWNFGGYMNNSWHRVRVRCTAPR